MNLMSPQTIFGIVGGDYRQAAVAKGLAEMGYCVKVFLMEHPPQFLQSKRCSDSLSELHYCDAVVLPLPVTAEGGELNTPLSHESVSLSKCLSYCRPDAVIFGGKVSESDLHTAENLGHHIIDYLKRDEMAILNAVPTAEGAVGLALSERAVTLWESRCLVTGFGRCAKALALLLKAFGAKVTVAARKDGDLAFARTLGFDTVPISRIQNVLPEQQVIFNTIPAIILNRERLSRLSSDCLIIDLASKPGGIDFDAASELGVKTIWALSLPGKVAPITAGNIIRDTILNIIDSQDTNE